MSGTIGGEIADKSLANYMPQLKGVPLKDTKISGGKISTTAMMPNGKMAELNLYDKNQFEKPEGPSALVEASDGSMWYQTATGDGAGAFFGTPGFAGDISEAARIHEMFPDLSEDTMLRTVDEGVLEASTDTGNSLWYSSAFYEEPDAPHGSIQASDGVDWYAMQQHAQTPTFESGEAADAYNQSQFQAFMPGYEQQVSSVDGSRRLEGQMEVQHGDGSGTRFYDTSQYAAPRGDYQVYEDSRGGQWYAIHGEAFVDRKPVYEDGKPVYEGDSVRTVSVESVRYRSTPERYAEPKKRDHSSAKSPKRKN